MNLSLGAKSISLFILSVIFLVFLTLFESLLSRVSLTTERIMSALLLVLPGIVGIVLGVLSILRKEPRVWVAILRVILNVLFALFQALIISFAG